MKIKIILPLITCASLFFTSCNYEPPVTEVSSEVPEEEETPPVTTPARKLYIEVGIQWFGAGDQFTTLASCDLLASDSATTRTCNLAIPEAQLYYSNVRFRVGSDSPTTCPIVSFIPYSYQRTEAADYLPPGEAQEIDCSSGDQTSLSPKCFGGAGPLLLPTNFPKYKGSYFLTAVTSFFDYTVTSENMSQKYPAAAGEKPVNYLVTNDLSISSRAIEVLTGQNQRVPSIVGPNQTFLDYQVECQDIYGETLSNATLIISDINEHNDATGASDQYTDWH